ncbi:MAG: hypothetical protein ABIO40_04860 [Devosia sp.]
MTNLARTSIASLLVAASITSGLSQGNSSTPSAAPSVDPVSDPELPPDAASATAFAIGAVERAEIQRLILEQHPSIVQSVDVALKVGMQVSAAIVLLPLPGTVTELVPTLAGHQFFILADGRIVICRPATRQIVLILAP